MTLTVGGNDVMAVIRNNLADLQVSSFKKPARQYQERLRKIIDLARKDNKELPIFVLGIYNPFYLNFPELTDMQKVIDDWNDKTKDVLGDYKHVYFVPINDLLYKGLMAKRGLFNRQETKPQLLTMPCLREIIFTPIILVIKSCQTQ